MPLGPPHLNRSSCMGTCLTGPAVLSKLGLGGDTELELRTLQLPVDYREAAQRVTRIWEDLQPHLAVHVGVDSCAKAIVLEQCGKNTGYREADIRGFRPEGGVCLPGGPEVILSEVSVRAVCRRVALEGIEVIFSRDAGRYVCDYTYYLSLHHGNGRAVLIHVPPLSPRLPAGLLGKALQALVQELLEEVAKPELKAWLAENSTLVLRAKGNHLGPLVGRWQPPRPPAPLLQLLPRDTSSSGPLTVLQHVRVLGDMPGLHLGEPPKAPSPPGLCNGTASPGNIQGACLFVADPRHF
ncbi:LOW QUALITY PROTEIN: pyroglutamyl-peptidase 1-like protein [Elephas maximus indicus]|uniref:LOW QUALITY PROTEIN: pyroglutamyl-peptidase 1-like protein n=1 Tax=Elephas maximus indicus TaxID=99487 RepID=UPI002116644F|nr:LOW QUALITY PROTEIN: pyroglutamyl-peptidase 1-like protein [Elephas maximus indicus]